MPRQAKLRQKNGYWYTAAGEGKYFGRIDVVNAATARQLFHEYLKSLAISWSAVDGSITVAGLAQQFVDWVRKFRSERTLDERRRHLEFFCNFGAGTQKLGELRATDVRASDLEAALEYLKVGDEKRKPVDPFTADKYSTSIKAAYNWGTKHPSPTPLLPVDFRPFASVEKYRKAVEAVMEDDLLDFTEIDALLAHADDDLGLLRAIRGFRNRQPEEFRLGENNPYRGFRDILTTYLHTGARTSELANALVGDYSRTSRQIVLKKHKRALTQKNASARRITVNDSAALILEQWCKGKRSDQPIFNDPKGRAWNRTRLDNRFQKVRERAGVRNEVTIYNFRHLWISEALMGGVDIATVARMAGTSIQMIERVYGHFRSDHLREAQARLDADRERRRAEATSKSTAA